MSNQILLKVRKRLEKIYCVVLTILLLIGIISVVFVHGLVGATVWSLELLIFSPIATLLSLLSIILVCISLKNKRRLNMKICILILTLLIATPMLVLTGVISFAYPKTGKEGPSITIKAPFLDKSNLVILGGDDYKTHAIWPSECYAYDILKEPYEIDSECLTDYGIFGKEVVAPIEGRVIAAYDEEEDIAPHQEEFTSEAGNYVYMKIEKTGTYLMFVHLMQHSVVVKVGDYLEVGDLIGKVGNSGTTSEPHLHLQHQKENPLKVIHSTCAEGLPIILE